MSTETYLTLAIICFIVAIVYFNFTNHPNDSKATLFQKIFLSIIIALILPLLIMGGLIILGLGIIGHGG